VIGSVNSGRLAFLASFGEVGTSSIVPMEGLVVVVLAQEGQEVGDAQDEAVVVDEGLRRDLLIYLLLASNDKLDVVDREGWH
jgi:hypothetical protein